MAGVTSLLLLFALLCLPLSASTLAPSDAARAARTVPVRDSWGPRVDLKDLPEKDLYEVHGTFHAAAKPEAVWRVLSDYSGLAGVVEGLKSSRVLGREHGAVLVEQVVEGRFLFFSRTLTLRLKVLEREPRRLDFSIVEPGPFRTYQGSWTLRPEAAGGCGVDYDLRVSRGDLAPRWLEPGLFRNNAAELMRSMGREIRRRAASSVGKRIPE